MTTIAQQYALRHIEKVLVFSSVYRLKNFGIYLSLFCKQTSRIKRAQARRATSSPTRPHSREKPNTSERRPPPEQTLSAELSTALPVASRESSQSRADQSQSPTVQFSPFRPSHWSAFSRRGSLPHAAIGYFSRLCASHLNTPPCRRRCTASQSVKVRRDDGAETHNGGGGE